MALTTLDPKTALVLIDMQKGFLSRPTAHPIDGVLERAVALADAFRARGLPIGPTWPPRSISSRKTTR